MSNIHITSNTYGLWLAFFPSFGVQWLYNVALVSAIQWSESTIYISSPSWTSLLPHPHPTHRGLHGPQSWATGGIQEVPTNSPFYTWECTYIYIYIVNYVKLKELIFHETHFMQFQSMTSDGITCKKFLSLP